METANCIPTYIRLSDLYDNSHGQIDEKHLPRFKFVIEQFKSIYGHDPLFFGRAPGRVCITGEHCDNFGYAVIPLAME